MEGYQPCDVVGNAPWDYNPPLPAPARHPRTLRGEMAKGGAGSWKKKKKKKKREKGKIDRQIDQQASKPASQQPTVQKPIRHTPDLARRIPRIAHQPLNQLPQQPVHLLPLPHPLSHHQAIRLRGAAMRRRDVARQGKRVRVRDRGRVDEGHGREEGREVGAPPRGGGVRVRVRVGCGGGGGDVVFY